MFINIVYLATLVVVASCTRVYQTKYITVPLDHFNFNDQRTFQLRYLVNDSYWDSENGPIFFYTGNEGSIELFVESTGFVWDIAVEFKAKVVFAEHRYYGETQPIPDSPPHYEFLMVEQVLADYAVLVNFLQNNADQPTNPVIAFGGSYGGILATLFRVKYAHLVEGAIAASAPLSTLSTSCSAFDEVVTDVYSKSGPNCVENIRKSWPVLQEYAADPVKNAWLFKEWKLCDPLDSASNIQTLISYVQNVYETLSMSNYPYPTVISTSLPANPVKYSCKFLADGSLSGDSLLSAVGQVLNTYGNYSGDAKCTDYKGGIAYLSGAFAYLVCAELVNPKCSTGVNDMFIPQPWDVNAFAAKCKAAFNVVTEVDRAKIQFGPDNLYAASNIVFSNGLIDPYSAGGILKNINKSLIAVKIPNAAHHLDLRGEDPSDSTCLRRARQIHKVNIRKWCNGFWARTKRN